MRRIMTFIIFAVVSVLLIAAAANNTLLIITTFFGSVFVVLFLASRIESFGMLFQRVFNRIVDNNNNIFYGVVLLIAALLIGGLWYGAGEPIFVSAIRAVILDDKGNSVYDDDMQKTVNEQLMRGRSITDNQAFQLKSELTVSPECVKKVTPIKDQKEPKDTKVAYVQKLNNYFDFGCFISDKEVEKILTEKTVWVAKESTLVKRANKPQSGFSKWLEPKKDKILGIEIDRTWFFWKALIIAFFVLLPLSIPISFSDEVSRALDAAVKKAKAIKEGKNRGVDNDDASGGSGMAEKATEVAKEQGGFLMKVLSVDIISEVVQVLIRAMKN